MVPATSPPMPEEFGLTPVSLGRVPEAFFVRHRGRAMIVGIGAAIAVGTLSVFLVSGSFAASLFFAPIVVVASLVVVLPLAVACLCAAGAIEIWWRSRTDPVFAACARYREACDAFQRESGYGGIGESRRRCAYWALRTREGLLDDVRASLAGAEVSTADQETSGIDLVVHGRDRTCLIRCEAGPEPAAAGVGRELLAALADLEADEALLVAPAGASPQLQQYTRGRPIRIFDASSLAEGGLEEYLA